MKRFTDGDRVRVDIPDETDPDHHLHGRHGTVVTVLEDDGGIVVGDERESSIFRVELDNGEALDFRWRDLRPP